MDLAWTFCSGCPPPPLFILLAIDIHVKKWRFVCCAALKNSLFLACSLCDPLSHCFIIVYRCWLKMNKDRCMSWQLCQAVWSVSRNNWFPWLVLFCLLAWSFRVGLYADVDTRGSPPWSDWRGFIATKERNFFLWTFLLKMHPTLLKSSHVKAGKSKRRYLFDWSEMLFDWPSGGLDATQFSINYD